MLKYIINLGGHYVSNIFYTTKIMVVH